MVARPALAGLSMPAPQQFVIAPQSGRVPMRPLELRGRLLDIGRFASDDSRLGPLDLPKVINIAVGDKWPACGQLLILAGATWSDADPGFVPTLRNLAMQPHRLEGQTVVVRGAIPPRRQTPVRDLP